LQKLGTISDLGPMERAMIIEVRDIFGEWEHMELMGFIPKFRPGIMVEMVDKLPGDGTLKVVVEGREYDIFNDMASSFFVKKIV